MLHRFCLSLLFYCFYLGMVSAQTCQYQLLLEDSFGDGWNGGEVVLRINNVATSYTLTEGNSNGARRAIFFTVSDGDDLVVDLVAGPFPDESSFAILDNNDSLLTQQDFPATDQAGVFQTQVACVACAAPPANSISFFRVRSTTVDLSFGSLPAAENPVYRIRYGGGDYNPAVDDDGLMVMGADTSYRVSGLAPDSMYTFWIDAICQNGADTTALRGPFEVTTQKQKDLGVTQLMAPVTGCNLSSEDVTIGITNFGGEPQAFFNVNFAIDGNLAGVERPADGIFTGVVGIDSTEFFTFDARAFLDRPGTYEFTLWTELEDDEDPSNDTLTISVTHVPLITDFPYFEGFEAGNGDWYTQSDGRGFNSWEWGVPAGNLISRAPQGRQAWVTNLDGDYNRSETSYLTSPCFDLTTMTEDPLFSCELFVATEVNFDHLALEVSTDEGANWTKVPTSPAGINWYNDLANQRWTGDGGFGGRTVTVAQLLEGVAGERLQIRFALNTNGFDQQEGILVDAVSLTERRGVNLAAAEASSVNTEACSSPTDSVRFRFTNLGVEPATDITVSYRVNGGTPVTEPVPGTLQAGQGRTYVFATPFDGTTLPESTIEVWTEQDDDFQLNNDTTVFFLRTRQEIPFFAGFSGPAAPAGWTLDDDLLLGDRNDDGEATLYDNLFSGDRDLSFRTANYGLIEAGDSLRFDVSLYNFGGLETPYTDTTDFRLLAFADCSADTIVLIDTVLVGDSMFLVALDAYAGSALQFDFRLSWRTGDFWANFDNINIRRCGDNLALAAEIIDATAMEATDGAATVNPGAGLAPYRYAWSNGDTLAISENLAVGDYTVTVTDAVGCIDEILLTVDFNTADQDPTTVLEGLAVFPNPTAGWLELRLDLAEATALRAEVYDLAGRQLIVRDFGRRRRLTEQLDLSQLPTGTYLLRVRAEQGVRTLKVIKR